MARNETVLSTGRASRPHYNSISQSMWRMWRLKHTKQTHETSRVLKFNVDDWKCSQEVSAWQPVAADGSTFAVSNGEAQNETKASLIRSNKLDRHIWHVSHCSHMRLEERRKNEQTCRVSQNPGNVPGRLHDCLQALRNIAANGKATWQLSLLSASNSLIDTPTKYKHGKKEQLSLGDRWRCFGCRLLTSVVLLRDLYNRNRDVGTNMYKYLFLCQRRQQTGDNELRFQSSVPSQWCR